MPLTLIIFVIALLIILIITICVVYIPVLLFRCFPSIQRSLIFKNCEYDCDLSQPAELGINCTRSLRIPVVIDDVNKSSSELGAWHILPGSRQSNYLAIQSDDKLAFSDLRPIVLYLHGNGGTRAGTDESDYRSCLYRRLAYEHDYHVVTFDYRGYGDSTYETPSKRGLSLDARFMYEWLLEQPTVTNNRVIVWGHSLGTGVAIQMVADLNDKLRPSKLILEAPFDSIANAVACHPISRRIRMLPFFSNLIVKPIEKSPELNFDSTKRISDIESTSIMILHAEDDITIPIKLGQNLYKKALESLDNGKVHFVPIAAEYGLGHRHIWSHDDTMGKVKQFINEL